MSPNPLSSRIEALAQAIAERIVPLVVEAIDIDGIIEQVDIDRIVKRVDVDAIADRVDVDKIADRLDIDKIADRLNIENIVQRVDVNAIVDKIDIDNLVQHTELGSLIAKSTTGVITELLDVVRSQGVGLDDFTFRWANRLVGRKVENLPLGPPLLVASTAVVS